MDSFLKLYSLPGKLIAELWYLWPKKGQIWASGRRREHGFVHFMYSTVFYFILIAIFVIAGNSGERRIEAVSEPQISSNYADRNDGPQGVYQPSSEQEPSPTKFEETETLPSEVETPPAIIFESRPVVQDVPVDEETPPSEADGTE